MRTYAGPQKRCWDVWHSSQELRHRQTLVQSRRNEDDENEGELDVEVDAAPIGLYR